MFLLITGEAATARLVKQETGFYTVELGGVLRDTKVIELPEGTGDRTATGMIGYVASYMARQGKNATIENIAYYIQEILLR